jgi:hypothetical protein
MLKYTQQELIELLEWEIKCLREELEKLKQWSDANGR